MLLHGASIWLLSDWLLPASSPVFGCRHRSNSHLLELRQSTPGMFVRGARFCQNSDLLGISELLSNVIGIVNSW